MKTSALRLLSFSLISIFCGTAAAYDADAKLEEMKALQVAMEQAQQDKNLPEAARLAKEIKAIAAEMQAKRAEREKAEEAAPEPTPEIKPVVAAQPTPVESAEPAEADQGSSYAKDIERLVKQRDSETAQAIAPIQKRFDLAAQQLLRKATLAGNLDAANKIKAAIENPPDLATLRQEASTQMDREFLRLMEQRDKDMAIASAPAQKRFDLATQQLLRKVTQTGNLEAANKLKEMIKETEASTGGSTSLASKTAPPSSSRPLSSSSSKIKENPETDFEVSFNGETAEITKYIGKSENVRVPAMIQGAPVTSIGRDAFWGCEIKEVVLPDTITEIHSRAFVQSSLTKIKIPQSVTKIGWGVFFTINLKELKIPANVCKIEGALTFYCRNLDKIEVDPANENYASVDGVLYDKQITTLINVPAGIKIKDLKVPNTVKRIVAGAFRGCNNGGSNIKTLQIPKDATIEDDAFREAPNMQVIRY